MDGSDSEFVPTPGDMGLGPDDMRTENAANTERRVGDDKKNELAKDFLEQKAGDLKSWVGGEVEKAQEAHRFMFERALEQESEESRREITEAHLQLELENNHSDRVQPTYGDELGKSGKPLSEVHSYLYSYQQMLATNSELVKGSGDTSTLVVENEKLLEPLIQFTEEAIKIKQQLEQMSPDDERIKSLVGRGLDTRDGSILLAAQRTAMSVMGMPNEHATTANHAMYKGSKPKLHEFFGKNLAVCTEYTALTQQFLAFAGAKSKFVSGVFGQKEEGILPIGGHTFIIFAAEQEDGNDRMLIFDPTNPVERSSEDPTVIKLSPYLVPLSDQQWKSYRTNKETLVEYLGVERMYSRV